MHSWQTVRSPNRAGRGNSVNSRSSLQRAVIIVHLGIFGIDIVQRVTLSCKYDNCHRSGKTGKQQFVAWSYRVKWGTEYNSERGRYHIGLHAWVKWQMFKLKMHAVTTRCELVDLFTAWVVSYASWVDGWVSGGVLRSDEVKLWTFWHHQTVAMKQERTRTVENKPKIANCAVNYVFCKHDIWSVKNRRKSSISIAVFQTLWPLSREGNVQTAQFKGCWMRGFVDMKLVGQWK